MTLALIQTLLKLIKRGVSWLKVEPETKDINFNSPNEKISINNRNIGNLTININKGAQDFKQEDLDTVLASAADDIKSKRGIGKHKLARDRISQYDRRSMNTREGD